MLPRFPCVQPPVNPYLDLAQLGDVPGALQGHHLKDNEPLPVTVALPDSCYFRGQRVEKSAPESPARRVIPPRGHDLQGFPTGMSRLVVLDPPTEVRSIVGLHPVSINLFDPQILPNGNVPRQISCIPLTVPHLVPLLFSPCLYVCSP